MTQDDEGLSVVSHMEEHEVRDIGFTDLALRLVLHEGKARTATLHWSTPTAYVMEDEGKAVKGADQFHKAQLPADLERLRKASQVLTEAVVYLDQLAVVNTTPEDEDGNEA